jgi:hypothetical protein
MSAFGRAARLGRDEVGHRRFAANQSVNLVLELPVRFGYALVLTPMLEPRIDQECLDEAPGLGSAFEQPPGVSAVSAALPRKLVQRCEERVTVVPIDAIVDCYEHRPRIILDRSGHDRRRPVAIAANSVGVNISRAIGPALGGVITVFIAAAGALLAIPLTWRYKLQVGATLDLAPSMIGIESVMSHAAAEL